MWLDLVAAIVLALFAARGLRRGAVVSFIRLCGLIVSYVAAVLLAPNLAPSVAARWQTPDIVAHLVAGSVVFVACWLVFGIVAWLVERSERKNLAGRSRSWADQLGGAILGAMPGMVVVVMLGWLAVGVDAVRAQTGLEWLPRSESSQVARLSGGIIETSFELALGDRGPAGTAVARAFANPTQTVERMASLAENPRFQRLQGDQNFWSHVEYQNYDAALNTNSFLELAYDRDTREQLGDLGLIDEEAVESPAAFQRAAEEAVRQMGPRIEAISPELERVKQNPEVQELVARGDTLGLLRHPDVLALINRALSKSENGAG